MNKQNMLRILSALMKKDNFMSVSELARESHVTFYTARDYCFRMFKFGLLKIKMGNSDKRIGCTYRISQQGVKYFNDEIQNPE